MIFNMTYTWFMFICALSAFIYSIGTTLYIYRQIQVLSIRIYRIQEKLIDIETIIAHRLKKNKDNDFD